MCVCLSVCVCFFARVCLCVFAIEILKIYMKHKQNANEIRKSAANRTTNNAALYILKFCGHFEVLEIFFQLAFRFLFVVCAKIIVAFSNNALVFCFCSMKNSFSCPTSILTSKMCLICGRGEGEVLSSVCHARNATHRPLASLWQQFQVPFQTPFPLASIIAISVALPAEHPHAH